MPHTFYDVEQQRTFRLKRDSHGTLKIVRVPKKEKSIPDFFYWDDVGFKKNSNGMRP